VFKTGGGLLSMPIRDHKREFKMQNFPDPQAPVCFKHNVGGWPMAVLTFFLFIDLLLLFL